MTQLTPINREILAFELTRDEGERLKAYRDTVGKLTIGVGRNLDDVGLHPGEEEQLGTTLADIRRDGITKAQSQIMLNNDINIAIRDLDRMFPWWSARLDEVRQRVLINMCFNMGIRTLGTFVNTLGKMARGDFEGAAEGMLQSKWAAQVGPRATRLANLMRLGVRK